MKSILRKIKDRIQKKKQKKKEPEQGIQATKYGIINNYIYSIKLSWKYYKQFIICMMAASAAAAIYQLIGVYFPKIALDLIVKNVSVERMVLVFACVGAVLLLFHYIEQRANTVCEFGFDKVQYHLMGNYLNKVFHTDFKNMENPDFLDLTERARRATYYGRGFHGYCMRMKDMTAYLLLTVLAGIPVLMIHPLLALILCVISFIRYYFFNSTMETDKVKFDNAMAGNWRKHIYLAQSTRDFSYAKDIRLFGMEKWIRYLWNDINTVFFAACKKRHNRWTMCEVRMSSMQLIQNVLLYGILIYMVMHQKMNISDFVLYVGLVATFSTATSDLFSSLVWMNMNKLQMDDFRTFMDWIEEKPNQEKGEGTITEIPAGQYAFTFENVSFRYPGHENYVLKNLNLNIEAGMKLAIVGINGAGKTTFTKLLMRLYEPTEGRILLNGVDIRKYDRSAYYRIFSPVFQNVEIFASPVWENISLMEREQTDMEEIAKALKSSGLHEKIQTLEQGAQTQLLRIFDEKGIDLSGGERQRLAMARALYRRRNVIVLDEPTAALDALAEDQMYQEFNEMVEGKTSIFISHRLSSTRFCDRIALFEDGQVIEEGTHEQLILKAGKYARMYQVQAQYYRKGGEADA